MSDNGYMKIDKVLPNSSQKLSRPESKESVRLDGTSPSHANELENSVNFKNIYSQYLNDTGIATNSVVSQQILEKEQIKAAMEDAQTTFETMMQIREELEKEFKGIVSLQ